MTTQKTLTDKFAFSSSLKADVWHPQKDPKAYEWWYFDALSDDASESIIIVFLDNFIYSPRYNRSEPSAAAAKLYNPSAHTDDSDKRFPAISITYFRDGKPRYHAVNEYSGRAFSASEDNPECRIGNCSFRFESASYGSGYNVSINTPLSRNRRLEAEFEWLSIESDFQPEAFSYGDSSHCWNMVAPRSDVTGKIMVYDSKGRKSDTRSFRGTGYHDHNLDNRWLAKTVRDWHWGRAHFADCTAVFYRYCEIGDDSPSTKLFIVRNGKLETRNVEYEEQNYVRDKFGIRYPTRLRLISEDNIRMSVNPLKVIDSSFYYLRFLSEITLTLSDEKQHKTTGITEFLAPKALKHRWLNWFSDVRTGKNGKGPLI
ncbi:hydroxyneurosporene dehydrogenase [soil metagenome]